MKKLNEIFKKYGWLIMLAILMTLFMIIVNSFSGNREVFIDTFVYKYISLIICKPMTIFFKVITQFGDIFVFAGIIVLSFILFKNKKYSILLSLNLVLSFIVKVILKGIFSRPRPIGISLIKETGFSFPSGHSTVSMAFYGLIIYMIYKSNISNKKKTIYCSLISLLIILIGLSRIYLGVHYFTDIVGGFILAICYLIIFTKFLYPQIIKMWNSFRKQYIVK